MKDAIKIARVCETIIRENNHIIFKIKNIKTILTIKTFKTVCHFVFNDMEMTEHIMQQNLLNNYKTKLIKSIIITYINLRLFYKDKCTTSIKQKDYFRHKFSTLIH